MNKYLLLRDNKQTGPYSVEELINMGLKPYDLVWLDGKSAAWRYPSEIAELQAFAPAVEEQPYDRFYKKKPATAQQQVNANTQQASAQTEAVVVTTPVATTPVTPNITAKKIYVTLPAGARDRGNTTATTDTNKAASPVPATQDGTEASAAKLLNEQFARLREEKMKQAENMAANPVVNIKTVVETPASPGFSEIVEKHYPQQEETLAPVIRQNGKDNRILMRSIAAACLVLGGIVIGLVISNSRQQKNNAELDLLVKQIQEREKRKETATQNLPSAAPVNTPAQSDTVPAEEPVYTTPEDDKKESIGTPVHNNNTANNQQAVLPPDAPQQQPVKFIPAVVTNKPGNKPVNREEVEQARKNIHQLVAVDANKYKTGVLGGISDLQLTISNNSLYPLDQVEVEVRYLGPEKRVVKTQLLLFNDVAPGEQKTIEAPRTNRGVTVDYVITRINSKALGLAHAGY